MHKVLSTLLISVALSIASLAWASTEVFEVIEIEGPVERASGPPELLALENKDEITPRVLLAFGKLPEHYLSLALGLRGSGIDLLRADSRQLDAFIAQAEAGEIDADPEELRNLRELMAKRDYLTWEPVQKGQKLAAGELLRAGKDTSLFLQTASGAERSISPNGVVRLDPDNPTLAWSSSAHTAVETSPTQAREQDHNLEQKGEPLENMSSRAAELFVAWSKTLNAPVCPIQLKGPIAVNETPEEIHLALPLKSHVPEPGNGDDVAQSVIHVRYVLNSEGEMPFDLQLPPLIWLFDPDGEPVGLLRMASQDITGMWAEAVHRPVQMNVQLQDLELLFGVNSVQDEAAEQVEISQLEWEMDMAREEMALWNGKGQLQVRDARIWECGEQVMNIKAISGHMQVQDQDLEAFSALFPAAGEGIEALDADVFARQLFQKMLTASGNGQFSVSVSDLEAGADIDPESLHIGQLEIKGGMQASEEWPDKRDMDVTYSLSDLKLLTEFSDLVLEEVSFTVGLAGLNLESIAELTDVSQSAEGNPFSALQNLLAGIEVSFTVSGLSGNHDQLDLSALHSLSAGLSLAGVNRSSQDIGLRYSHAGLRDVKGVPAELMPEHTALGLRLYQVPVVELVLASLMGSELAQDMMMEILSRSGSRLELEQLEVDLPGGGITARGRALARSQEGGDDIEQPVLDIETDLEIRGLEHLVQAVTAQMEDEEEIQQIQAVAAFIQLAANEEERDGTSVHLLKIVGDSQGRITVNDKDLAPLFTGAGDKQGKD